tara:strand:+ start:116 stop:679 length:564 start_codon:yes stop_codon:yes gene_type:complete
VLKERIQEIFDFTKSESPYRKANKGWINQDIFLDLSPSSDNLTRKNEVAKITLLWSPISGLLSNIFLIIIIGSLLVFTSLSFVRGRFDFDLLNVSVTNNIVEVVDNKMINTSDENVMETRNSKMQENLDISEAGEINNQKSLDTKQINSDKEIKTNEMNKQDYKINDIKIKKDTKKLENKKSKSNFI